MLENLLFPDIKETPETIIEKYPKRKDWLVVTRIAPSPTWFLHIWAIYSAMLDKIIAHKNNWIFYLRIEDTDQKREVEWAAHKYVDIMKQFWLVFDEGPVWTDYIDVWNYWPYTQSRRENIYKVFIKDLVKKWLAYPCFLSEQEINETRQIQEASKIPTWIYKEYSPWRFATEEELKTALDEWKDFVIRLKSKWEISRKIDLNDIIKWKITTWENFLDIVICKSNWIPTYHFAHLIDDFLMWTTHVIRWDEWFASLPLHMELFAMMWWKAPLYAHYWPLVKIDWNGKRKLSKRKDPEADIEYYFKAWYMIDSIIDFLSNIINSGFEDWRKQNPEKSYLDYDFKFEKINTAWALVDIDKLNFVNANIIKNMDDETIYKKLLEYLSKYDIELLNTIQNFDDKYNIKIIRELKTKIKKFDEFRENTHFLYNESEIPSNELMINEKMKITDIETVKKALNLSLEILKSRKNDFESIDEIKNIFVEKILNADMKNWQVLWPVRCALSWEQFSPWALELLYILWIDKSIQRIEKVLKNI